MKNLVFLSGNLSKEPELRKTNSDISVASCTVAVNEGSGEKKTTTFVNFSTFRQSAEFLTKWFHKGDPIEITGRLSVRSYTDKEGNKRTATEVVVNELGFCPRKGKSEGGASAPTQGGKTNIDVGTDDYGMETIDGDDDLPF